jgi:hypothetical protein
MLGRGTVLVYTEPAGQATRSCSSRAGPVFGQSSYTGRNSHLLDGESRTCARHDRCFALPSTFARKRERGEDHMNTPEKPEPTKKWKAVYTIVEREGLSKPYWVRIGIAFINQDQSLAVKLDAVPTNGNLHIRDPEPYDPTRARRNNGNATNTNALNDPFAPRVIS